MTNITEETALNLLEAILILNAKMDDLDKKIDEFWNSPIPPPSSPTPPPISSPIIDSQTTGMISPPSLPEGKLGKDQTEVIMSAGPMLPRKDGTKKPAYMYIGGPEYDVTKSSNPPTPLTTDCEHNWQPVEGTTIMICSKCHTELSGTSPQQKEPEEDKEPEEPKKTKYEDRIRGLAKRIKELQPPADRKD